MKWLALGLLILPALYADETIKTPVHRFEIGPDIFWSHYRSGFEGDSEGTKLSASIDGYYAGIRLGYDYLQSDALYAGTEAVICWGRDNIRKKNSTTHLSSSNQKTKSEHEHQTRLWTTVEQRLGYNSQSTVFPEFIVTPYLGIGWHYEGTSSDHAFWYYGAAGLKTIQKFYDRFMIGVDLKLMYGFDVHDKRFVSITTTQGKKTFWGFEAALPFRWLLGSSNRWDFEFEPYLLKLNLNSPQTIVGARLLLGYSF
jgi:hypothetical protein